MSKNELRPQTLKTPLKVEVKTALPWTLMLMLAFTLAGIVTGWNLRSNYVVTPADVRAQIVEQLAVKK